MMRAKCDKKESPLQSLTATGRRNILSIRLSKPQMRRARCRHHLHHHHRHHVAGKLHLIRSLLRFAL